MRTSARRRWFEGSLGGRLRRVLPSRRNRRMVFHMKTTLIIEDAVFRRLKQEAARQGRTISELVEAALRIFLDRRPRVTAVPPLPSFDGGGALVDVSNRDALYKAMEGR